MGLDMYLETQDYISGWGFRKDERFGAVLDLLGVSTDDITPDAPSIRVSYNVAYWRKANAIHHWFVEKVQNGKDECQRSYVPREQLLQLRDLARDAFALYREGKKGTAAQLLPPQEGFFFGSTSIDDGYAEDLEYTVKKLTAVLDNPRWKDCDFYYRASW